MRIRLYFYLGTCWNTQQPVVLGGLQILLRLTIVDSEASMSVVFLELSIREVLRQAPSRCLCLFQ